MFTGKCCAQRLYKLTLERKVFLFMACSACTGLSVLMAAVSFLNYKPLKIFADYLLFADFKFNLYQGMDLRMEATFLIKSLPFFQSLSPLQE